MDILQIAATESTPAVTLDKATGTFLFEGKSLADRAGDFYRPAIQWLGEYAKAPSSITTLVFKLEYVNTSSSKAIFDLLSLAQTIPGARVVWYFHDEDEDMEETGEEFSSLVKLPFEMKAY